MKKSELIAELNKRRWFIETGTGLESWEEKPEEFDNENTTASSNYDPGRIYKLQDLQALLTDDNQVLAVNTEEQETAKTALVRLGIVPEANDIGFTRIITPVWVTDYATVPVDKASTVRLDELQALCEKAERPFETLAHILGLPEMKCWAPSTAEGNLLLSISYGYGGGIHRKELLEPVVENLWKPLGLVEALDAKRSFVHSQAGCYSPGERPVLYINLEYPDIFEKMQNLLERNAHLIAAADTKQKETGKDRSRWN